MVTMEVGEERTVGHTYVDVEVMAENWPVENWKDNLKKKAYVDKDERLTGVGICKDCKSFGKRPWQNTCAIKKGLVGKSWPSKAKKS